MSSQRRHLGLTVDDDEHGRFLAGEDRRRIVGEGQRPGSLRAAVDVRQHSVERDLACGARHQAAQGFEVRGGVGLAGGREVGVEDFEVVSDDQTLLEVGLGRRDEVEGADHAALGTRRFDGHGGPRFEPLAVIPGVDLRLVDGDDGAVGRQHLSGPAEVTGRELGRQQRRLRMRRGLGGTGGSAARVSPEGKDEDQGGTKKRGRALGWARSHGFT